MVVVITEADANWHYRLWVVDPVLFEKVDLRILDDRENIPTESEEPPNAAIFILMSTAMDSEAFNYCLFLIFQCDSFGPYGPFNILICFLANALTG